MNPPTVRLSCEQCRRRKTKCDKEVPCSACENAGLDCNTIQRARLPRGRSGKVQKKASLLDTRLTHIENLVKQLEAKTRTGSDETDGSDGKDGDHPEDAIISDPAMLPAVKKSNFLAQEFWTTLSQEVSGLRDILEDSDDEEASQDPSSATPPFASESSSTSGMLLFNHNPLAIDSSVFQSPSRQTRTTLLKLYQQRVDALLKIVDFSTMNAVIESKYSNASITPQSPALQALEYSMYLTALCSITDDESENMLLGKRQPLIQQYQSAAETWISRAGLLTNPSLTVLQAFILYLSALRSATRYASSWTLLAIAVRVARALGLGSEDFKKWSPYDLELRRRLWFCIGVIDTQTALDRGSVPLLHFEDLGVLPLNINDVNMSPTFMTAYPEQGFTDMSFSLVTYEATLCQKKICVPLVRSENCWDAWNHKIQVLEEFEKSMSQQYYGVNEFSKPIERFTKMVAQGAVTNLQLLLRRPLHIYGHDTVPVWDNFNVMEAATNVLEQSLGKTAFYEFSPWAWWSWVKWYALAVVLAELCSRPEALSDNRAYLIAQQSYEQYSRLIADTESGMLWKPISRLMRRVQYLRTLKAEQPTTAEQLYQSNVHTSSQDGPVSGSREQINQYSEQRFDYRDQASQQEEPQNFERNGCALDNDTHEIFKSSEDMGLDEGFGFENEMRWLNWDDFLEDMNRSSGMP